MTPDFSLRPDRQTHPLVLYLISSLCVVLSCAGCATPGPSAAPVPASPSFLSRDGVIRYRLPAGWFDATPDTLTPDRAVWLVRDDYAGSMTVRQVHMHAIERADLGGEGLLEVGKLTAALEMSGRPGILARGPERFHLNGRDAVVYDIEYSGSGDRTRTVLFTADGRLYALRALVNGTAPPGAVKEIFGVLQSFLAALRT